jgi:hypothetical protein
MKRLSTVAVHGQSNRFIILRGWINGKVLKTVEYTEDCRATFYSLPDMRQKRIGLKMTILDRGNIFVVVGDSNTPFGWINERTRSCFLNESAKNK